MKNNQSNENNNLQKEDETTSMYTYIKRQTAKD